MSGSTDVSRYRNSNQMVPWSSDHGARGHPGRGRAVRDAVHPSTNHTVTNTDQALRYITASPPGLLTSSLAQGYGRPLVGTIPAGANPQGFLVKPQGSWAAEIYL